MLQNTLLIQQILTGDAKALEQLIQKSYAKIYAHVLFRIKNLEDAQEITQDTFIKAYQNLHTLKQPESFEPWIRQIATHQCLNWIRRKKPETINLPDEIKDTTTLTDEKMIQNEILKEIVNAIETLPNLERHLLKAHYLERTSYTDLQKIHGLSYKAITMRVLRAKRQIVRTLNETSIPFQLTPDQEALLSVAFSPSKPTLSKGAANMNRLDFRAPHPAKKEGKFGYIDKTGEITIPPQFDRAMSFTEGLGRVAIGDKQGYINEAGEFAIPLQFNEAYPFSENLAGAKVEDKFGFIDKSGDFVIAPQFDDVEHFSDGCAAVQVDNKWGYINKKGAYIAEPQFDKVWPFNDGIAPVNMGTASGYINQEGTLIYSWEINVS